MPFVEPPEPAAPVRRRAHPSRGARAVALVASVAATGSVGAAMAYADRSGGTVAAGTTEDLAAAQPAGAPATTVAPARAPAPTASAPSPTITTVPAKPAGPADGTWTGPAEYTRWGNVQVRVTISGGEIVDVVALQIPSDRKSASINGRAQPILEAEAVAEQGADIDIVSGATYTSRTYAASLQGALDAAAQAQVKTGRT